MIESLPLAISLDFLSAWDFWIGVGILAGIYAIFTLGLQLNVGFTGVLNFGQAGFMAVGAYSSIILTVDVGMPFYLTLPISAGITIISALIIGMSSLRLRADYFSIATIAFAEIIRDVIQNARDLTGGNQGTIDLELANDNGFYTDSWYEVVRLDPGEPAGPDRSFGYAILGPATVPRHLVGAVPLRVRAKSPDPFALGPRPAGRSRGRRCRQSARQERLLLQASVALDRRRARRRFRLVPRDQSRVGLPGGVRAALHLPRLCDPRDRRPGEFLAGLWSGRSSCGSSWRA